MKSFIALVVAIGLVSVEGTSIIRHVMSNALGRTKDHGHTPLDGGNAMLTGQIENKLRNIGTLENVFREKKGIPSFNCTNSYCFFCKYEFCLKVTYNSSSNSFGVRGTFLGGYVFSSTIHVKPWSDCETIETALSSFRACLTIKKVKIMEGRICTDVLVRTGPLLYKTFSDMCI